MVLGSFLGLNLPVFAFLLRFKYFDWAHLLKAARGKRIKISCVKTFWDAKRGAYVFGTHPLKLGTRFEVSELISEKPILALSKYYKRPRLYFYLISVQKFVYLLSHLMQDLEERNLRDAKLVLPPKGKQFLTPDEARTNLFDIIDFIARRNGLKYSEVEALPDLQYYGILRAVWREELARMRAEEYYKKRNEIKKL